ARNDAARLAHDDLACGNVPGLQVTLPVAIEATGRDKGQVERSRTKPAQAGDAVLDFRHLLPRQLKVAAPDMRQAAGDHAFGEFSPPRDTNPLVVEESALAAFGGVEFVIGGI